MATFMELINSDKPVLVDFTATWCGPCQMMAPVIKDLAEAVGDKAKIIKVDIDKNPKAAAHYQVRSVPTFILFKNGNILWRQSGAIPKHILQNAIESNLE